MSIPGNLFGGAASGAAGGAAGGPIGAGVGAALGFAGAGVAALGARRRRGQVEQLLQSLRTQNRAQASSVAASQPGITAGQRSSIEGQVLSGMNMRSDPLVAQLAQSETEAERRRRAVLFGGLGGSLAAAGQMVNMTGQSMGTPGVAQDPLQEFYGQGMKPEGAGVPMEVPAAQGLMQQPQANPMMQGLRQDFVQGTYGAASGGTQPNIGVDFARGGTPLISDPNVAIPPTPILDQPMTSENANEQARAIFENVSGQQWQAPAPRRTAAPVQPNQQTVPPPARFFDVGPESLTSEQRQQQQEAEIEANLYQAIGRERNMLRRNQMITRYLRMQALRGGF